MFSINRKGKGIGALKDHAHLFAQAEQVGSGGEDVLAVDNDLAFDAHAVDQVVHAVEHPQQGALAAAAGPDQGGHLADGYAQIDPGKGLEIAVKKVQGAGFYTDLVHVSQTCRLCNRWCADRPAW